MKMQKDQAHAGGFPCWIEMVNQIHQVLGFSYAHIAYRIGCSPSSIQKLVKNLTRTPRDKILFQLTCYYYKLFYSEFSTPKAKKFIAENNSQTIDETIIELLQRGFIDGAPVATNLQKAKEQFFQLAQNKDSLGKEKAEDTLLLLNKVSSFAFFNVN